MLLTKRLAFAPSLILEDDVTGPLKVGAAPIFRRLRRHHHHHHLQKQIDMLFTVKDIGIGHKLFLLVY
jgi:hypothetical protein